MIARSIARALPLLVLVSACQNPPASPPERAQPEPPAFTAPDPSTPGAQLYTKYCTQCHGAQLQGYVADNAPSLVSPTFRSTASPEFLRVAIERGRPGTAMGAYGQAYAGPLSSADVVTLVAYLRTGAPPLETPRNLPHPTGDAARGKPLYDQECAHCHGTPERREKALHLANPVLLASAPDDFLRVAIERGRPGTRMDPYLGKLEAGQIEDVLAYVRSMATPVPPAPVPPPMPPGPPDQARLPITGPVVIHPDGKAPEFQLREDLYVPVEQVGRAYKDGRRMIILDARPPSEYLGLHIVGSVSLPYYDFTDLEKVPDDGTWVIAYCACPHHLSGEVVTELRKRGYKHTAVLDEGIYVWQQQGNPVYAAPGQPMAPLAPPMPGSGPFAPRMPGPGPLAPPMPGFNAPPPPVPGAPAPSPSSPNRGR